MTSAGQYRAGFTLAEVMVAAALGGVVMAATLSAFVFLGGNLARLASYQSLESASRTALGYLSRDLALAQAVKSGTTPTESTVTLVVPAGEITYTYDATARQLRREANFGANQDFILLRNSGCECTEFSFRYFTTTEGAPVDQLTGVAYVPYSIKQIQARFVVESPAGWAADVRNRFAAASSRHLLRYRVAADGT